MIKGPVRLSINRVDFGHAAGQLGPQALFHREINLPEPDDRRLAAGGAVAERAERRAKVLEDFLDAPCRVDLQHQSSIRLCGLIVLGLSIAGSGRRR